MPATDDLQVAFNEGNVALLNALKKTNAASSNTTETKMDVEDYAANQTLVDSLAASEFVRDSDSESVDMEPIPYAEV